MPCPLLSRFTTRSRYPTGTRRSSSGSSIWPPGGRRPSTLIYYGDELRRFAAWSKARGLTPYSVSRVHIDDYVIDIRTERNLGGRSIAARITAIRQFFKWLGNRELRTDDPTLFTQNPKFRKLFPQPLSHDELAVLLELPLRGGDGPIVRRDAALLRTLAWAGLRVSEAASLDWDRIDLTPGKGTIAVVDGKGGKDRVVLVAEPLGDALLSYLELRLPLGIKRWVWQSQRGHRLTTRGIGDMVGRYGDRIGRKLSPHCLRAQCGVEMVRQGGSLGEIGGVREQSVVSERSSATPASGGNRMPGHRQQDLRGSLMSAVADLADLWDLEETDRRILDAADEATRLPLWDRLAIAPDPAPYLIRYHGAHPDYQGEAVNSRAIYVGSALSLARRLTEHRASLRAVVELDVGDFSVAFLRATSHGQALYVEERLIVRLDRRWNRPNLAGFGSKHQGKLRASGQEPSAWDQRHPGRAWARTA